MLDPSDDSYRSLFDNLPNGLAHCRMIYGERGEPVDFVYLEVNPAFEALTGLKEVVGKRVTEAIPGIRESDPRLFEIFGRVARGEPPERFETYVEALGEWFSISVYSPRAEHFVAVFDVISERKRAAQELARQVAASKEEPIARPAHTTGELAAARGRVLVVDDDAQIRKMMARVLRGHEVVLCASGAEAKQTLAGDQSFDLILCDLMMPDVSGMDLHRWLAETEPKLAARIIFVSGGAFTARAQRYLQDCGNLSIEKPVDVAVVKRIVAEQILAARTPS